MIKIFEKFSEIHKDIDPYEEENWDEKDEGEYNDDDSDLWRWREGTRLICINDYNLKGILTKGKIYILEESPSFLNNMWRVVIIDDLGRKVYSQKRKFRRVE